MGSHTSCSHGGPDGALPGGRRRVLTLLLAFAGLLTACGGDGDGGAGPDGAEVDTEALVLRDRAAVLFADGKYEDALAAVAPLVARPEPALDDLLRSVCLAYELYDLEAARTHIERARALDEADSRVQWALYRLARFDGDYEGALAHLRRAADANPDSYATQLALASQLLDLQQDEEAEALFLDLLERGPEEGGSWYHTATFKYTRLLRMNGRTEDADRWTEVFAELEDQGIEGPDEASSERGDLGVLPPARPKPVAVSEPRALPAGARLEAGELQPLPGVAGLASLTLRPTSDPGVDTPLDQGRYDDWSSREVGRSQLYRLPAGPTALLAWGEGGVRLLHPAGGDTFREERLLDGPCPAAAAADLDLDGFLDVVASTASGLRLLRGSADGFTVDDAPLLTPAAPATDICPVDFDHEGDTDLLVVGPAGVSLLRNDGVDAPGGRFTDVAAEAGLPHDRPARWCLVEDFDTDADVDLLLGLAAGPWLASNDRGGEFSDARDRLPHEMPVLPEPWAGDLDADGRPDLASVDAGELRLWLARVPGGWAERSGGKGPADPSPVGGLLAADPFREGSPRLLWPVGRAGVGSRLPLPGAEAPDTPAADGLSLALIDTDGDGLQELVRGTSEGLTVLRVQGARPGGLTLALEGLKDPGRGLGAIVELRAGALYARHYARGQALSLGVGDAAAVDVLRVTWPNGVVQSVLDLAVGDSYLMHQKDGFVGSCPFLYTWNGTTYEFITDVLGGTPLGLPMAPGMLVPPDHDEFVLVRGDQLVPRDGVLEVQLTEELREVTYLDRVRLDVVDHPAGTELQPNERFSFPPFPEEKRHVFADAAAPLVAVDDTGRDWTWELAAEDGALARPYRALGGRFLGLSEPHTLELRFDPTVVAGASDPWLALSGWFLWSDASVNVSAARHPVASFEPPVIQVPDGDGGWRDAGESIGFPAGKAKTMLVPLAGVLDPADPRLRLRTTLCLAWDALRLVPHGTDGPSRVTSLEPARADLWRRGFSERLPHPEEPFLERFDWDALMAEPRWNQHPGMYTRYGDVLPLLGAVDDRFVIFGSGDAVTVAFDATALPPPPEGWTRDYLLYLDGWAKDRDPNTVSALHVAPLPFHGMSGYPYGADERFPDTPEHRAWRAEWNTRPAHRWIEPLAPPAPARQEDAR